MIHTTLNFINTELNNFAQQRYNISSFCSLQNIAQLGNGGSVTTPLTISLIHVEEDRVAKSPNQYLRTGSGIYNINWTVPVNLYCLFAGVTDTQAFPDSGNYLESLKAVSVVLRFFQTKNVFTPANSPIDPRIAQLVADLYTLSFQELNDVWMSNGGKYYPSIIYKLRTLYYEDDPMGEVGLVTNIDVNAQGN